MREFDTPEEAALAGWSHTPSANARVVELRHDGDVALVVIQVDGAPGFHDRDACTCERLPNGKWRCTSSTGWRRALRTTFAGLTGLYVEAAADAGAAQEPQCQHGQRELADRTGAEAEM